MSSLVIRAALGLLAGTLVAFAMASGAPAPAHGPDDDEPAARAKAAPAAPAAGASLESAAYFHVGDGFTREFYEVGDPVVRRRIMVQGFDGDGGRRWSFLVPKKRGGFELIFGFEEGTLKLYAFKVDRKRVKSDLVTLSTPAVIGTAEQVVGGGAHQTAVAASAPVDVDLKGIKQRVNADMTGTIGASWLPAAPVKVDADTEYADVVTLKLDVMLKVAAPVFGMPMEYELDTELDGTLARDFGYVELRIDGDVFRLLPD